MNLCIILDTGDIDELIEELGTTLIGQQIDDV